MTIQKESTFFQGRFVFDGAMFIEVDIDLSGPAYNVINLFTLKFLHKFGVVNPHHEERISTPLPFLCID